MPKIHLHQLLKFDLLVFLISCYSKLKRFGLFLQNEMLNYVMLW